MRIELPEFPLILLVGPGFAGKRRVDIGCAFGGKLTCIRYTEIEVVSAAAHRRIVSVY